MLLIAELITLMAKTKLSLIPALLKNIKIVFRLFSYCCTYNKWVKRKNTLRSMQEKAKRKYMSIVVFAEATDINKWNVRLIITYT